MEAFDFEINVSSERDYFATDGNLIVQGVVRHSHNQKVEVGNADGGNQLKLGYRIYSDSAKTEMLFEDRAHFDVDVLEPARLYSFRVDIPERFRSVDRWLLFLDFVYENEYWFYERGREPFFSDISREAIGIRSQVAVSQDLIQSPRRNDSRHIVSPVSCFPIEQEERFGKAAPNLLPAVADAIQAIADRYGFRLAVEFAYLFILGRRADPLALSEKSLSLSTKKSSLNEVCAQMLASEEYQARIIIQHRDPKVVISSWAVIDEP